MSITIKPVILSGGSGIHLCLLSRQLFEMIEVQSGSYLGEDDIVRFEGIYGR